MVQKLNHEMFSYCFKIFLCEIDMRNRFAKFYRILNKKIRKDLLSADLVAGHDFPQCFAARPTSTLSRDHALPT